MSEYQYYEFQALDRPLTQEQMSELRAYSSRAQITPSSFVNVYHWGSFKGNPEKWMEKYFDAFLYLANWGTRRLMFRVPNRLVDPETVSTYCTEESLSCRTKGDHLILSFHSEEEDHEWAEGESWLASLVPLRTDVMNGDHRCLYLGWLLAAQGDELDEDTIEPPVPPGLGEMNAPLRSLADFLGIDLDLISVASEKSAKAPAFGLTNGDISRWVASLPPKEKDAVLMKLLRGDDPHIATELRKRALSEIRGQGNLGSDSSSDDRRSVGRLVARAAVVAEERQKKETEQRAQEKARRERAQAEQRKKHLEALAGKESALWARFDKLIATKQPKQYDEAVSLLQDLHDLSDMRGQSSDFSSRMSALRSEHSRKTALVNRLRKAKLLG